MVRRVDTEFLTVMEKIVASIKATGNDPYDQLYGYITTGKIEYITRHGNAREIVKKLDQLAIKNYLENIKNGKGK